jgi:GNAT superfamily N-acetyltransferase
MATGTTLDAVNDLLPNAEFLVYAIDKTVKASSKESMDLEDEAEAVAQELRSKYPGLQLDYHYDDRHGTLIVSRVVVPKDKRNQGIGTSVMQRLVEFAKAKGLKTALTPEPIGERGSKERLRKFYKGFGFKKNKDPRVSESMMASMGPKYWIAPDGEIHDAFFSHSEWISTSYDEWSKFDESGELEAKINKIVADEGDIPEYEMPLEEPFLRAGWVRVDGDSIVGRADRLPTMKRYVKDHILREDRERKVYAQIMDGYPFEGRAMDFMSWDGAPTVKAAKFDDLRKAALRLIEDDPTWKSLLDNAESAQAYGQLQQSVRDARSDEELKKAWETHMDLPWEAVVAESGGRRK